MRLCLHTRKMSNSSPPPRVVLIDDSKSIDYVELEEDNEEQVTAEPFTPTPDPVFPDYEDFAKEGNYRLYDILWSDGRASQHLRPVSDGAVPIGLCVIPTNWLDEGEKARFMSLKYMSSKTPESGGLESEYFIWGKAYYDITPEPEFFDKYSYINELEYIPYYEYANVSSTFCPATTTPNTTLQPENSTTPIATLEDYWIPYMCKNDQTGLNHGAGIIGTGWYEAEAWYYITTKSENLSDIKDLRDRENWLYTLNYCKENPGKYAIGDIDGKQNTINISVEGNYNEDTRYYEDMKSYVAQYSPISTQPGDWYVPATGELLQFVFRLHNDNGLSINNKLAKIHEVYSKDCVNKYVSRSYWSSTVKSGATAYACSVVVDSAGHKCNLHYNFRSTNELVVAFLQR